MTQLSGQIREAFESAMAVLSEAVFPSDGVVISVPSGRSIWVMTIGSIGVASPRARPGSRAAPGAKADEPQESRVSHHENQAAIRRTSQRRPTLRNGETVSFSGGPRPSTLRMTLPDPFAMNDRLTNGTSSCLNPTSQAESARVYRVADGRTLSAGSGPILKGMSCYAAFRIASAHRASDVRTQSRSHGLG